MNLIFPVDSSYSDPMGPLQERPKTSRRLLTESDFADVEVGEDLLPLWITFDIPHIQSIHARMIKKKAAVKPILIKIPHEIFSFGRWTFHYCYLLMETWDCNIKVAYYNLRYFMFINLSGKRTSRNEIHIEIRI